MSVYNDQSVPFGSRIEVIGSGTHVLEDITLTYPSKVTERPNEIGEPNGWFAVRGLPTGSAVVQMATASSSLPKLGDTFSDTFSGTSPETWVITQVGQPYAYGGYYKVNVNLTMANISGGYVNSGNPTFHN